MDIEQKVNLVKQVGEEIITEPELRQLFETKEHPIAYDGFEPSGKIHIAQGLLRAVNVNKLTSTGIHFKFWVADWFALMNNKLGRDLEKIQTVGNYFIEVWKACGMNLKNVEFLWASKNMDQDYWLRTIKIGTNTTVPRIIRCAQIMGRSEQETLSAAQVFYPCMQASDVFQLKVDITQLGMDQRKVNMLVREIAPKMNFKPPVVVSHHMLMGLNPPKTEVQGVDRVITIKMSKSNPDSAIFMTDTQKDIINKFNKAYCPEKQVEDNPILEYCKYIIFEKYKTFDVERPEKFGGNVSFDSYKELEKTFVAGKLHPMDLKQTTAKYVDQLIDPVRKHFETNKKAKELLQTVSGYIATR
ncbi:MAG: tyrosine--tRNA ligase [Candidatus Diapherotrites archaeon CG08_land_8_20_14_0_20_30_16]|nr:MAG: tyrosine--tRNA ligase [Candidatus Diapherotrites archaeon CG08_land_8_20_14_0_20_30_16]